MKMRAVCRACGAEQSEFSGGAVYTCEKCGMMMPVPHETTDVPEGMPSLDRIYESLRESYDNGYKLAEYWLSGRCRGAAYEREPEFWWACFLLEYRVLYRDGRISHVDYLNRHSGLSENPFYAKALELAAPEVQRIYEMQAREIEAECGRRAAENSRSERPDSEYARARKLAEEGEIYRAALLYSLCPEHEDSREQCRELWKRIRSGNRGAIACSRQVIALKKDGTVVTTAKESGTGEWRDITAVATGEDWFAGLKRDGSVVVTKKSLQSAVDGWADITQIAAGLHHIVGLKADGTAVAAGDNEYGQCDVEGWEYITEIAAGERHTVGMTGWGSVYAVGDNRGGQCKIGGSDGEWSDVTAIACGCDHTVTINSDGRLVLYGAGETGDRLADESDGIAAVFSGRGTVGMLLNGRPFCASLRDQVEQQHEYERVFAGREWGIDEYSMDRKSINGAYDVEEWQGILAMSSGYAATVGLCADGTLRAAFAKPCMGEYFETPAFSGADIADWKDIRVILTQECDAPLRGEGKEKYPIMEFDDNTVAVIDPVDQAEGRFSTDKMIITFFPEVMERLEAEGRIRLERRIPDENPLLIYRFADSDVLITLGQVGCPACAGNLEIFHAMGIERVMFCGGGGVLDKDIEVGKLLVVDGAIRDEGFSYHYVPPSRYIYTDPDVTGTVIRYLEEHSIPHIRGLVWTTDAIFRETQDRVARRKAEGAKMVEMEQAGCIAVAQCRGFKYAALIYGGDDVSGTEWDHRGWRSDNGLRYDLVELCRKLVGIL